MQARKTYAQRIGPFSIMWRRGVGYIITNCVTQEVRIEDRFKHVMLYLIGFLDGYYAH